MLRKLPFSDRLMRKRSNEEEPPSPPQSTQGEMHTAHAGTPPPRPALGGVVAPFGWEVAVSRSTGEQYFVNTATGESTFTLPEFTVGEKLEQLKNEQEHLLVVLGENPDNLECLERLKEVDYAMGLLIRPPAAESPTHADYGARDASPTPLEDDCDSASASNSSDDDDYDDDDPEDGEFNDLDDIYASKGEVAAQNHDPEQTTGQLVGQDANNVNDLDDDYVGDGEVASQHNSQASTAGQLQQDANNGDNGASSLTTSENLQQLKSPEPRSAHASRSPPRSPTVPKTTGVFAKLTDPGQYTGSHATRHGGGFAVSPAVQELNLPTKEERDAAFRRIDCNGNGTLSLAEIDKAVIEIWPRFDHKRALMRAYKAADRNKDGFVERNEFRLLLKYILYFNRLWDEFDAIDMNHDHRLDMHEFYRGCGQIGLKLSEAEARHAFDTMDRNHGGYVLFDEFCSWCARTFHADEVRTTGSENDEGVPVVEEQDECEHEDAQNENNLESLQSSFTEPQPQEKATVDTVTGGENATKPRSDFLSQAEELMAQLNATTSANPCVADSATDMILLEPDLESEREQEQQGQQRTFSAVSSADTTGESLLPSGIGGDRASLSFGAQSPIIAALDDGIGKDLGTQSYESGAGSHSESSRNEAAGESALQLHPDFGAKDENDNIDDLEVDVPLTEHVEADAARQGHHVHQDQQSNNKHGRTLDPPTPDPPLPPPRSPAAVVKHIRAGMRAQRLRNSDLLRNLKTTRPDKAKTKSGAIARTGADGAYETDLVDAAGLGAALKALNMPMDEVELTNLLAEIGSNEHGCVSLADLQAYLKRGGRRRHRAKMSTAMSRPYEVSFSSTLLEGNTVSAHVVPGLNATSSEATEDDKVGTNGRSTNAQQAQQAQMQQQVAESTRLLAQKLDKVRRKLQSTSYGKQGQDPARLFRQWDRSKTGAISIAEFETAIRKGGEASKGELSDADLRLIFLAADTDQDGAISASELTEFVWGSFEVLHERLIEAAFQAQLVAAAEQKVPGSKVPFSPFWSAKMGHIEPDRQSPVVAGKAAAERSPGLGRDSPSPRSSTPDSLGASGDQQADFERHGQGGFVSLRAQVTALQRQLSLERGRRQASDDRAKEAEQRARYQLEQNAAHELRQKAKLAGVAASVPVAREAKEMEAEIVRLRTMVRELKRERAKTAEQTHDDQRRHEAQISAGQTRRLKQLEADMVTIRAHNKRLSSELENVQAALKEKDQVCQQQRKERATLKRLLAEAKTRQEAAVTDALAAAEVQIAALQARNSRLLTTMQAAAVAPHSYGPVHSSPEGAAGFCDRLSPTPAGFIETGASATRRFHDNGHGGQDIVDDTISTQPRRNTNAKTRSKGKSPGAKVSNKKYMKPKVRYGRQPLSVETSLSPEVERARAVAKVALANKREADQMKQLQSAAHLQHIRTTAASKLKHPGTNATREGDAQDIAGADFLGAEQGMEVEERLAPMKRTGSEDQDDWTVAEPVPASPAGSDSTLNSTPRTTDDANGFDHIAASPLELPVQEVVEEEGAHVEEELLL